MTKTPETPRGAAFIEAAHAERATHTGRGWPIEHDRERGPEHPLRLALDYLANGKPVEAGSLILAALDLLAAARVAPVTPSEAASAEDLLKMICLLAEESQDHPIDVLNNVVLLISDHWGQTDTDEETDRARELRESLAGDILAERRLLGSAAVVSPVTPSDTPPERDATPDEAFELGRVAGYDEAMAERTAPSPNREKLESLLWDARVVKLAEPAFYKDEPVAWVNTPLTALLDLLDSAAAALAVPPVVNEAKLAEVLRAAEVEYLDKMHDWTDEEGEPELPSAFRARRAVEHQGEWLGAPRSPQEGGAE